MKRKLNCILLIDDDEPTNYIHERIIEEVGCTEKIVAIQSARQALDFLKSKTDGAYPQPDLIFLDINMPAMTGWGFLEKYRELDKDQQGRVIIVMLTTSLHPDDERKAQSIPEVNRYFIKPLSPEMLQEILEEYFEDCL